MNTDKHRFRKNWPFSILYLCSSVFIGGSISFGQGVNPQSLYGRDTTQGVYVRDSAVAVEKFALAERMEHLKEWDKSADVYMEILKSYADRVVPSQIDKDNKIYQYTSVTPAVQERLAKWPEEGLTSYKRRYEGEASALLDAAGDDPAQLHRVFSLYFVTDSAKRAAIRLMDLYLERGEFPAAAWTGQRLLDWHPGLADDQPRILYRTALAYHLADNDEQAQARLAELKAKFPQAIATVRGGDVVLADSLATELAASQAKVHESGGDSWPMTFGSPDRSRVPQVNGFGGARLFGVDIGKPNLRAVAPPQRRDLQATNERDRGNGLMTGIFPVVDRGELFFQDNARIYAVSLESGLPLPGWAQTYDGDREGRFTLNNAWPTPRAQQCTISVTDDSVLAIMGQPDMIAMQFTNTYGQRDTRLVCLDRHTGKMRWTVSPRQLPEVAQNLRTLDLLGSPLVVGDTVYVQARGGKGMQFEDAYVMAFDLASGKYKWACYIASANSGSQFWDGDISSALGGQNVSHLAYSSGRLYALTNLGAVAAIDAYDGTIVWLNIYPRDVIEAGRNMGGFGGWNRRAVQMGATNGTDKPWSYNPVIVTEGKVFVLPSDGLNIHIYDAGSGIEVKRILLSQFDNAQTMLGVVDEKLVVATDRQIFCIDWLNYDSAKKRVENLVWATNALVKQGSSADESIRGRGFVTTDSVIVPTAWQLLKLSLRNGKVVEAYPPGAGASWGEDEGPGNILVTQDRLVIAGPAQVNVYTDLVVAMNKLDAAVAASPDDPAPRLRYAEIMFVAGKRDVAISKLDEAMNLLGGAHAAERDRAFTDALSFADKLARENRPDSIEMAGGLYDRAGAAASTASQKVSYRLGRAAFSRQHNQPDQELKLYQEVLSDPDMRAVLYPDVDGDPVAASVVARRGIDNLIKRVGPDIYAPYEKAAGEMFTAAQVRNDPEQLQSVAQVYPNSSAALKALLTAAETYESNNNARRATQVLRQAYLRCTDQSQRVQVLESLARNYLTMPNRIDVALARLNQAVKAGESGDAPRLSKALLLPDGKKIEQGTSFADATAVLKQFGAAASARDLPDIALPPLPPIRDAGRAAAQRSRLVTFLPEGAESTVPGIAALLVPAPEFSRNDRIVTFTPAVGLRIYPIGRTQPSATFDAIAQLPQGVAWVNPQTLLVWTESEIFSISPDASQVQWRAGIKSLPQVEMVAQATGGARDDEDAAPGVADAQQPQAQPQDQQGGDVFIVGGGQAQQRILIRNGQRIIIQRGGQIRFVNGPGGIQAVPQPPVGGPLAPPPKPGAEQISQVRPLSDRVIVATSTGRVFALDLDSGKTIWQTRLGERGPTHLIANDDFVVARLATDDTGLNVQLVVLDAFGGQILSRRNFGSDAVVGMVPVNLALSPDGTLVFLLPDRVCIKDLFEPGGLDKAIEVANRRNDATLPFQSSIAPDHLQISGDRIFIVADDGRSIRMHSLRDGSALRFNQSDAGFSLGAGGAGGRVAMRVVWPHVYVANQKEMRQYDVERGTSWNLPLDYRTVVRVRDLIVARDHVIRLTEPAGAQGRRAPNQQPMPILQFKAFSRAPDAKGDESGVLEHNLDLSDNAAIVQWQAVDGGFYYLAGDQELHFLKGARKG